MPSAAAETARLTIAGSTTVTSPADPPEGVPPVRCSESDAAAVRLPLLPRGPDATGDCVGTCSLACALWVDYKKKSRHG
ncbi:hypothetical protein GCM10017688_26660 [Streptomyces ramulosus]